MNRVGEGRRVGSYEVFERVVEVRVWEAGRVLTKRSFWTWQLARVVGVMERTDVVLCAGLEGEVSQP